MPKPYTSQISKIEIEGLFDRYDYNLALPSVNEQGSRIAILYGDNGSGKTTILKAIFHLLSTTVRRGHKSFLAGTRFKRIVVLFTDGRTISVSRDEPPFIGSFDMRLSIGKQSFSARYEANDEFIIPGGSSTSKTDDLENEMRKMDLSVFLLGDDRKLESDRLGDDVVEWLESPSDLETERLITVARLMERRRSRLGQRDLAVQESLYRVTSWLRTRMIERSSQGESDAQQIYANIIATINSGVSNQESLSQLKERLIQDLETLESRSRTFSQIGIYQTIRAEPIILGLNNCTEETFPSVAQVVQSLLEGQNARLNALDSLNSLMDRFQSLINGFFIDKEIQINVATGVQINSDMGTTLSPENLSSGEQQLLLLFANVLVASSSASLFIVDEPELSLNVKWQRLLLDALLEITQGSSCQFLLATHSIEMLTKHRDHVIELVSSR